MSKLNSKMTRRQYESNKQKFDTGRIYMAEVMDVRNTSRSGELLVYIIGSELEKNDSRNWIVASYASNFYGTTPYDRNSSPDYAQDPKSFGSWFPMPCVGNYVFIFFPVSSGENTNAFWFACPINPNANYMLPGIPGRYCNENYNIEEEEEKNEKETSNIIKTKTKTKIKNKTLNKKTEENKESTSEIDHCPLCERNDKEYTGKENKNYNYNILDGQKKQAVYEPLNAALIRQGLNNDSLRGYGTTGAKRESPSMCYGILTPMGNSFVIDDGWSISDNTTTWNFKGNDEDKLSDDDINKKRKLVGKDGKSPWQRTYTEEQTDDFKRHDAGFRLRTRNGTQVLVSDEGTIYAINSEGNAWVEITKNGHIECYSKRGITMSSEGDINFHTFGNILMESGGNISFKSNSSMNIETIGDINIAQTKHINTEASISATEILAENGNISTFQSAESQIMGTFTGTLDGTAYYASYAGMVPVLQPQALVYEPELIKPIEQEKHNIKVRDDTTYSNVINTKITSSEPYLCHAQDAEINEQQDNISTPLPFNDNNAEGCRRAMGINNGKTSNQGATNQVCKNPAINTIDKKPIGQDIPEMQLSEHFTLRQLCYSDTANRNHIKNVPTQQAVDNLKLLCENILEPIYNEFDGRVQINSGYRNPEVNALVGSKSTSQHSTGQACDVEVPGLSTWDLAQWVRDNLTFDQLILENCTNLRLDPNSGWVHISFNNSNNRKQELTYKNGCYNSGLHR